MAAAKCNITFNIDYTSSKLITEATATYKHKITGATQVFSINPIPLSGELIYLPEIQIQGEYDLIVKLTASDGVVATKTSSFKIGNCSGSNPPSVLIRWDDGLGTEPRFCNSGVCNFTIENYATDPDNDIVLNQVFKSTDNGVTWSVLVANATQSTFSDSISSVGTQMYKVVVTDSVGSTATSNILSYTKHEEISKFYSKKINKINCEGRGDSPTNYDVWCAGQEDFALSNSDLINSSVGFIRLKVDGGTSEIGLSKFDGGGLFINEVLPVNSVLTVSYAAAGQNPPSAYPSGYPANASSAVYRFQYSVNGTTDWVDIDLSLDD